ncbi:aspartate aminotransferase [Clostridium sp. USBA 49]|uniref:pyridoxal phosphate-dependent aminotransferase n=1 Tax=Clostridium sp. USBA 49 TaxID=1881060 RepID=UPI00099A3C36|nr:pyridoxal phosphate-dependent aminotransferase [Clostridium sp. USBA 49]SKA76658.1 aspartate aminotransferase [Clostridium sp. USBA 49]
MDFSNRIKNMQFSPIRKLAPFAEAAQKKGIKIYHLNIGQPDIKTPDIFLKTIKNFNESILSYVNSQGIPELIQSFIKYYKTLNIDFEEDEIMITNGGSEALTFALMSICDVDDEIIIPEPFYTNYNSFSSIANVKVVSFLTNPEDGFHLPDKKTITDKITNRTKAILISNPGNPTGVVYSYDEIRMLADIAKEYNIYIIADEVYREFIYDDLKFTSMLSMSDILDRVILIDSISKRYSACGARIGLIASKNKDLMKEILKLCQARLSCATIEQLAAASLINTPRSYFNEVKAEYETRRNIMYNNLSKIPGVVCKKPSGAFYIIVKLPIQDAEDFAKWLLTDFSYNNETIMVAPAEGFYASKELGKDKIRLSYCINCEDLKKAINILSLGLEKYLILQKK